ncbi:MAG: hypothetical protein ACRDN9_06215 [Streptosporangiaceae bacterium]
MSTPRLRITAAVVCSLALVVAGSPSAARAAATGSGEQRTCGTTGMHVSRQLDELSANSGHTVEPADLGLPSSSFDVTVIARADTSCDTAERVMRYAFDPKHSGEGPAFLASPDGWGCNLSEASPHPVADCVRTAGQAPQAIAKAPISAFLASAAPSSDSGGREDCGTVKTAAGVPASVEVRGKGIDCDAALHVMRDYYAALGGGKGPGMGGGGPIHVRGGGHRWRCGSGPATNPYSECTSGSTTIRADVKTGRGQKLDPLQAAAARGGNQAGRLPRAGERPYEPPKGTHGIPQRIRGGGGFKDRYGNRWKWDPIKGEWDVTHRDKSHTNIGPDGKITHGPDNFPNRSRGGSNGGEGNNAARAVAVKAGAGVGLVTILWYAGKLLSPACGPAFGICAVAL